MENAFSRRRALQVLGAGLVTNLTAAWAQPPASQPPIRPLPPRPFPQPPTPLITVSSVTLNAEVREGVATVEVSYIFKNASPVEGEADFVFPLPPGTSVREFALYDGEKKFDAHLLNKDEATQVYEEIVRRRRDPALLSYVGQGLLRARVFPIPRNGERRVTLKLVSILPREGAAKKFVWALAGPHLPGGMRPEYVSVRVVAHGAGSLYSPSHNVTLKRLDETRLSAEWTSSKDAAALVEHPELALYISPKDTSAVALSLLAYNAALPQVASIGGGLHQSGYFLMVASPNLPKTALKDLPPRRVVLMMDRSGSMQGKKLEQARSALKFAVGKLRPQDSFNLLTFSDAVTRFAPEPVLATPDNLKRAAAFIDDMVADGGTNINDALTEGLKQFPERGTGNRLLFFTDGLPTVGVRDHATILRNAVTAAQSRARCFVFGVGYDVDVPFLDQVGSKLKGDADYVHPDEDIELKTSQFVAKTSTAVLENLKLQLAGIKSGELYPRPDELPDLFEGGQLVLVGRYTGEGTARVQLTGDVLGKPQTFTLETKLAAVSTEASFLPRLWASRKIGYLLDEIRDEKDPARHKELEDQIIALSKEFGVLTPYTALFVPEPGTADVEPATRVLGRPGLLPNGPGGGQSRASIGGFGGAMGGGGFAAKADLRTGQDAINQSQGARSGRGQNQTGNQAVIATQKGLSKQVAEEQARRIQYAGNRAFYQRGASWEDATYDPKKQTEVVKIKLFSDAYFAVLKRGGEWAKWAAVGESVLVVANNKQAIQFGEQGKERLTEKELTELLGK
ncbi:VIT and vWA domain-containing protein [Armatimonas rosea]|uniref:Ca-activated chloride channel family protein n=1 Tax=Armatimonas rosea TaxID=685828 RepID=A0A7W9W587_ARMRO|nr:VIT and VWA domain-containing protein [Armatimonas rosea]MBB6048660.1 Ca-activated chloride channel family protein [Armatimonas rosea]